jgi:long-chain acyl-CoA synthetase
MGRLDEDGFLYFLGRTKDIIICGGINIYPADIEAVVNAHGSVLESAAFAFPDANLGEVVAVAVVPADKAAFDQNDIQSLSHDSKCTLCSSPRSKVGA